MAKTRLPYTPEFRRSSRHIVAIGKAAGVHQLDHPSDARSSSAGPITTRGMAFNDRARLGNQNAHCYC